MEKAVSGHGTFIYDAAATALGPEQRKTFDLQFADINRGFPLHSYNEAPDGGPSLPQATPSWRRLAERLGSTRPSWRTRDPAPGGCLAPAGREEAARFPAKRSVRSCGS